MRTITAVLRSCALGGLLFVCVSDAVKAGGTVANLIMYPSFTPNERRGTRCLIARRAFRAGAKMSWHSWQSTFARHPEEARKSRSGWHQQHHFA